MSTIVKLPCRPLPTCVPSLRAASTVNSNGLGSCVWVQRTEDWSRMADDISARIACADFPARSSGSVVVVVAGATVVLVVEVVDVVVDLTVLVVVVVEGRTVEVVAATVVEMLVVVVLVELDDASVVALGDEQAASKTADATVPTTIEEGTPLPSCPLHGSPD